MSAEAVYFYYLDYFLSQQLRWRLTAFAKFSSNHLDYQLRYHYFQHCHPHNYCLKDFDVIGSAGFRPSGSPCLASATMQYQ